MRWNNAWIWDVWHTPLGFILVGMCFEIKAVPYDKRMTRQEDDDDEPEEEIAQQ